MTVVRAALWSSLFWGVCFLAPTWLHAHRDSALYPVGVYLFAALGVALVVAALTLPLAAKQVRHNQLPGQIALDRKRARLTIQGDVQ